MLWPTRVVFVAVVLCGAMWRASGAVQSDLIGQLPGLQGKPSFKQYSGYLKATGTRQLHYWFVESASNPQKDPLVVWLNGGPGCSSMEGILAENGPFTVTDNGKRLVPNPYSWNKVANVLYLEAPAGVGYSYSVDKNYTTNDDQVALDNHWALKYFLMHFTEFSKNDFYITGESYAGIYVPTLAVRIMKDKDFNLKGIGIGNGLSDFALNSDSALYFGNYHGLWGNILWDRLISNCCKNKNSGRFCTFVLSKDPTCQQAVKEAADIVNSLNIYNLFDPCYKGPEGENLTRIHSTSYFLFAGNPHVDAELKVVRSQPSSRFSVTPPCVNAHPITAYMNRADVRKAIHIPSALPTWQICSAEVGNNYQTLYSDMRSQYKQLQATGKYKILVYNGDFDMACNFLGDQAFVDSLGFKVLNETHAWTYKAADGSRQVAGFVKHFENLVFTTVKDAGHMVPQDKPLQALQMISHFVWANDVHGLYAALTGR